jgi:hypothetical protein
MIILSGLRVSPLSTAATTGLLYEINNDTANNNSVLYFYNNNKLVGPLSPRHGASLGCW